MAPVEVLGEEERGIEVNDVGEDQLFSHHNGIPDADGFRF